MLSQCHAVQDDALRERLKANEQRLQNLDIEDLDAGDLPYPIQFINLTGLFWKLHVQLEGRSQCCQSIFSHHRHTVLNARQQL